MNHSQLTELMHAVLDGEATAAQKRELERRLTSDPAARLEYDALRAIFFDLKTLPSVYPPAEATSIRELARGLEVPVDRVVAPVDALLRYRPERRLSTKFFTFVTAPPVNVSSLSPPSHLLSPVIFTAPP